MSIFDRFKKSVPPPPPAGSSEPAPPLGGSLPPLPARGRIISYSLVDAVGMLALESTEGGAPALIRFGRSACRGFEPVERAEVMVGAIGPALSGGIRALELTLPPDAEADYDALIAARDQAAGISRPSTPAEIAGTAEQLAWITVLLDQPIAPGLAGAHALSAELGLPAQGISVAVEPRLSFTIGGDTFSTFTGAEPFPRSSMDLRLVPPDFDTGRGFVALASGLPSQRPADSARLGQVIDSGRNEMRGLARIARALLARGTGVVLNQAGQKVMGKEEFLRLLGDLDDPAARPFGAWIDFALTGERDAVRTFGMSAFWLPDVQVKLRDPDDRWETDRRLEAMLFCASRMIHRLEIPALGSELACPLGVTVGPHAIEPSPSDELESYRVIKSEVELISLEASGPLASPAERWNRAHAPGAPPLSFNTYRLLFEAAAERALGMTVIAGITPAEVPAALPRAVVVLESRERAHAVLSIGIGRFVQPGGRQTELYAEIDAHGPPIALALSTLGSLLHLHQGGSGTWKPYDTVSLPEPMFGLRFFLLAPRPAIPLAADLEPPIELLEVIVLEEAERAALSSAELAIRWLSDPARDRAALRRRWNAALSS